MVDIRMNMTLEPGKNENGRKAGKINCRECTYFYITWEKRTPNGCRGHGFKSLQMPSIVVFSSSGADCLLFKPKNRGNQ